MASDAKSGIVQFFERSVKDGVPVVDVQVDTGGGRLLTIDHEGSSGSDCPPLAGDYAAISAATGAGAARSAGYTDPKNAGKALGGEHRSYARDPQTGEAVCEVWLKGPGRVVITALKAGADIELSTKPSGGVIDLNGVKIDANGNITTPGEVTAKLGSTPVKLTTHQHPTGVGPSGPPTPNT
jgi:hypothetical protein